MSARRSTRTRKSSVNFNSPVIKEEELEDLTPIALSRTRKTRVQVSTPVIKKEELEDATPTAISLRSNLRPREKKNYKADSFSGSLDGDNDDSFDKDFSAKSETDSDSNSSSSDSELFSKKKRKLNSSRRDDNSLLQIFERIDPTEEENEYRLQRQKNMQDRFKILGSLDFDKDIDELKSVATVKKIERPKRPKKPVKSPQPKLPAKRSLRLQNKSLNIILDKTIEPELQFGSITAESEKDDRPRIIDENVAFIEDGADENMSEILKTLKDDVNLPYEETCGFSSGEYDKYCEIVRSCRMRYEPFKIIKSRIVSMDFHPSAKKLILLAGDKVGNLAIQDIVKNDVGLEFKAHAYNVNCVSFSTQDHTKFFSTSLEGVTRQGDMNSSKSTLVYQADRDEHTTWHHEFGHSLFVSEGDGVVKLVDLRTPDYESVSFKCHSRSVRTVQLHPTNDNYFLTGSGYGEFGIFDIRSSSSEKPNPVILQDFSKALTSAFFSAKGNYVISTCNDDTIRVFDVSNSKTSNQITKINHNVHTGRWLSVFKAKWHPGREDAFLVGSMMNNPKRFILYHRNGEIIHQFTSPDMLTYSPVVVAHPSQPIIVGGNGSGKIHIFSPFASLDEIYS